MDVDWVAVSQLIGGLGQGVGAIVVAFAALLGLGAWKKQLRGTRRHALAEECLSNAYQLRHIVDDLRRSIAWASEMDQVVAEPGESDESRRNRAHLGVVEVRFSPYATSFAAMLTSRFRLRTVFGKEVSDSFEDLLFAVTEVRNAAIQAVGAGRQFDKLLELAEEQPSHTPARDAAWDHLMKMHAVIWSNQSGVDQMAQRVNSSVLFLESRLRREAGAE
jgi:hypothetical protein